MKLHTVPASRGAQWVLQGLRAFASRPMLYLSLIGMWMLLAVVVQIIPLIGTIVMWAALPLVTLGFMLTTQQVLQGAPPNLQAFVQPLRGDPRRRRTLWQLGAIYALVMVVVIGGFALIVGNDVALPTPPPPGSNAPPPTLDPRLQSGLLWMAAATVLLSIPFWFAPALVHWGGHSAGQSLFSSVVAVWRNKGAFIVYSLTNAAAVVVVALAASLLVGLLGVASQQTAMALLVPIAFVMMAVFYASLYFTYADCFGAPTAEEPTA
ncbi:MAG: hypothetical protein KF892_09305 [Rhizobacter sp.]|nr:hypothetical protein [Rhizobacter sp.]